MNLLRTFFFVTTSLFLSGTPQEASAQTLAKKIAHAEAQPPAEALKLLKEVDAQHPNDPVVLATLAIAWAESGKDEASARKAITTAEEALKLAPQLGKAHLALAIGYGKLTDYVDNQTKMALSQKIRDEATAAIKYDPKTDLAYQILGRWHYGIATLNPMLKLAARVVYGKLPPASLTEAQTFLEEATRLNPSRISNRYYLAIVYEANKEPQKARPQWEAILKLPAENQEDREAQAAAKKALR